MAQGKISPKQQEILEYIKSQILERGFPPAVRDICEAVHLKSTSSVHSHLETLEKNGYIRRDPTKPRAIEILDESFNFTRREMVNVPMVGRVAAGEPLLAEQNVENYFPIPMEFMPNNQTFMLRVKGDSMINIGIFDGDLVLVEGGRLRRVRLVQRVINPRSIGRRGELYLRTAGDRARGRVRRGRLSLGRWNYAFFTRIKPFSVTTLPPIMASPMTARRPSANL